MNRKSTPAPRRKGLNKQQLGKFIGQQIKVARREAGFTQETLARRLRHSKVWMVAAEKAHNKIKVVDLVRIAELTGKEIGWFLPEP